MKDARVDEKTGDIFKANALGKEAKIGLMVDGKPRRGFATPSRKFSVYHEDIEAAAKERKFDEDGGKGMPDYFPIPSIAKMKPEQLHLVTFKWNVHTRAARNRKNSCLKSCTTTRCGSTQTQRANGASKPATG